MKKFLSSINQKGMFFYLNVCLTLIGGFLLRPLFNHDSTEPLLFTYSAKYLLYMATFSFPLICFVILIGVSDARINKISFYFVAISFVLLELILPFFSPDSPYYRNLYQYPQPYVQFTGEPNAEATGIPMMLYGEEKGGQTRLNNLGFRIERELTVQKPDNEKRIFVLGGSTVFNGNPLINSIPSQIEHFFRSDGFTNVKVYNFGAVGYVSGQELSLLLHTLVDYKPDIVIVYNGGNDINTPYNYDPRPGYPMNFMTYEQSINCLRSKNKHFSEAFASLLYNSKVLRTLFARSIHDKIISLDKHREKAGYKSVEWEEKAVKNYSTNLKKMCGIAKGFNFKVAVFLQPLANFKKPLVGKEQLLLGGMQFREYIERLYDKFGREFMILNDIYNDDTDCFFVDMSSAMEGFQEETYWDFIHTDNNGNRFLASKIYSYMKSNAHLYSADTSD